MDLEGRGVPSAFVATTEFVAASKAQGSALSFDPAVVFVAHPIQDRTDDEIQALATEAVDEILSTIRKG